MAEYMLILHDQPADFSQVSPADMQAIIGEYVAWRDGLERAGRLVGSNKLKDEGGRVMTRAEEQVRVVDGPYAEAKEVVGGYFLIEADDYDHAVELCRDCPHLTYGLRIEVREVDPHGD